MSKWASDYHRQDYGRDRDSGWDRERDWDRRDRDRDRDRDWDRQYDTNKDKGWDSSRDRDWNRDRQWEQRDRERDGWGRSNWDQWDTRDEPPSTGNQLDRNGLTERPIPVPQSQQQQPKPRTNGANFTALSRAVKFLVSSQLSKFLGPKKYFAGSEPELVKACNHLIDKVYNVEKTKGPEAHHRRKMHEGVVSYVNAYMEKYAVRKAKKIKTRRDERGEGDHKKKRRKAGRYGAVSLFESPFIMDSATEDEGSDESSIEKPLTIPNVISQPDPLTPSPMRDPVKVDYGFSEEQDEETFHPSMMKESPADCYLVQSQASILEQTKQVDALSDGEESPPNNGLKREKLPGPDDQ